MTKEKDEHEMDRRKETILDLLLQVQKGFIKVEILDNVLRKMEREGSYTKEQCGKIKDFFIKAKTCHVCEGGRVCPDCGEDDYHRFRTGPDDTTAMLCGNCGFEGPCPQCKGRGFLYYGNIDDNFESQIQDLFGG